MHAMGGKVVTKTLRKAMIPSSSINAISKTYSKILIRNTTIASWLCSLPPVLYHSIFPLDCPE